MKLFAFTDLHGSYKHLKNLVEFFANNNAEIDAIVSAGDFVNMGEPVYFIDDLILAVEKIGKPFLWVPGNNDFGRSYYKLNAKIKSIEGKVIELSGQKFTGVGGSPESWAGQYQGETTDQEYNIANSIFISHVPPPGLLVMEKGDCKSPTDKKLSNAPKLHLCGHRHARWGCGYLGKTKVINPGPLAEGRYAIIDLDSLAVSFGKFFQRKFVSN